MDKFLEGRIKAQVDVFSEGFKAGEEKGFREGYLKGIVEAQRIINDTLGKKEKENKEGC